MISHYSLFNFAKNEPEDLEDYSRDESNSIFLSGTEEALIKQESVCFKIEKYQGDKDEHKLLEYL